MDFHPVVIGSPLYLQAYLVPVRAGFPSPADDYLDAPIDLSRTLIQNAPATFIMTVAGNSAIDVGIFDGSLITVDRSLKPRDGDAVVVDVNGERSVKLMRLVAGRLRLAYPTTPDGRYFIVAGRLWRSTNPAISENERQDLVDQLMDARRAVKDAKAGKGDMKAARAAVDAAKVALRESGPVWWDDGAPDFNRHMAKNTPYADWASALKS